MSPQLSLARQLTCAGVLCLGSLACARGEPAQKKGVARGEIQQLCPSGLSEDPPRSKIELGLRAFRDKNYVQAQQVYGDLLQSYPNSATVEAWLGDALLFDKALESRAAAEKALPHYHRAAELHEQGCVLPRRARYYQLMGQAYAELRLAVPGSSRELLSLNLAQEALGRAEAEFPSSAEIPYTEARVACAQAGLSSASPEQRQAKTTSCVEYFRRTLNIAESLDRPRFIRTHRSTQDWLDRAASQSELGPLRGDARYQAIRTEALLGLSRESQEL